ncbi:MAG: hypothetical protein K9L60_05620 [Methylovulum sp.]|nr:hypothetical protein [Methylovulum sp.]MCF7998694.1 hypothetical protein [Methylovulum sp.]
MRYQSGLYKGIISKIPLKQVKGIKVAATERIYLATEEVRQLAKTDFRWSDIKKLDWSQISRGFNSLSAIENTRIERRLAVIVLSFFQSDQRRDVHETRH